MFKISFSKLIIVLLSFGIIFSPLITDKNNLPTGWELPKVIFIQGFCALLILLSLANRIYKRDLNFSIYYILIAVLIVSTLLSENREIAIYGNQFRNAGLLT